MAFHWAGDGHCAMALEYHRVLQEVHGEMIGADARPKLGGVQPPPSRAPAASPALVQGLFAAPELCVSMQLLK
jgi:hypothetical protein